jgi:phenylacetate-coenzyme A ligase PaaK-like adenylate-forming protein
MDTATREAAQQQASYPESVARVQRELIDLGQMSPDDLEDVQRKRLIAIISHHYYNTLNDTYRRIVQRHGIEWGEPAGSSGVFGRLFARRAARPLEQQRVPIPDTMPVSEILAMLPIVDKRMLFDGHYNEHPAVPMDQIQGTPASSGTTTGTRAFTALSRNGLWHFIVEPLVMAMMLGGLDPLTSHGYLIAHFRRDDPADARASATYVALSELARIAPQVFTLGSTQDTLADHIAKMGPPTDFAFSSPHFFRQVVARVSRDELQRLSLQAILYGGGDLPPEDREVVKQGLGLRHVLGYYAVSEMGLLAFQIDDPLPYSTQPMNALVEILDDSDKPVSAGSVGSVVLTSLSHDATPIVRYRVGDTARSLGHFHDDGALWSALGVQPPRADWSERSLLAMGLVRHSLFFDNITRSGGLIIGDGKVSYEDVTAMQQAMAQAGTPVVVFQLAKRLAADGRHEVVVRIEAPPEQADRVRTNALAALRLSQQLAYLFDDGELPPPVIEVMAPGTLGAGKFKVPPIVDETKRSDLAVPRP